MYWIDTAAADHTAAVSPAPAAPPAASTLDDDAIDWSIELTTTSRR